MSEFEFEKKQIWKAAALVLCVALVGLLAFLLWREEQKRAESQLLYEQMEEELRPLSVEMYDLENKLEELEKDYNSEQQGMGSLIFLFTDLDEIIYTDIFPQMQEYGFTGVLCLSADHIPGNEGCLTQPQLEELMAAGWECCLVWEEEMEYEEWASVCQEVEEAAGIETPDTVYTMADTYNRDLDRFFEEQGFSAVIHHGEEALPLVQTDLEEGIWHLGAVAWIQNGAGSLLASAASQGGNLVFHIPDVVRDVILAPQVRNLFTQDYIIPLGIGVQRNTGHTRDFDKSVYQALRIRDSGSVYNQTDHNFLCLKSIAQQNVTHQAGALGFIVRLYPVFFHIGNYLFQNFLVHLCPQKAVLVGYNRMSSACIKACDYFAVTVKTYRKLGFVPVTPGMLHTYHLICL